LLFENFHGYLISRFFSKRVTKLGVKQQDREKYFNFRRLLEKITFQGYLISREILYPRNFITLRYKK